MSNSPSEYIRLRQCQNINVDCYIRDLTIKWDAFQLLSSVGDAWNFFYAEVAYVANNHASMKSELEVHIYPGSGHIFISLLKQMDKA